MTPDLWIQGLVSLIAAGLGAWGAGYLREKGKNLAQKEDITRLTKLVEDVKLENERLMADIRHQNNLVLEGQRASNSLRLIAADRRVEAHQQAFVLWRRLMRSIHQGEERWKVVQESQTWWEENCLYLEPAARHVFADSYHDVAMFQNLPAQQAADVWKGLVRASDTILTCINLPPLSEKSIQRLQEPLPPLQSQMQDGQAS